MEKNFYTYLCMHMYLSTYMDSKDQIQVVCRYFSCLTILLGPKRHLVKGHMDGQAEDCLFTCMLVTSARKKLATDLGPLMKGAIPLSHTVCVTSATMTQQEKAVEINRQKSKKPD